MKTLVHFAAASAAVAALVACHQQPRFVAPPPPQESSPPVQETSTPAQDASASIAEELKLQLAIERELRAKAEARVNEQEVAKSHWQTGTMLAATGAGFLLIFGAGLGTRARHDAENQEAE